MLVFGRHLEVLCVKIGDDSISFLQALHFDTLISLHFLVAIALRFPQTVTFSMC